MANLKYSSVSESVATPIDNRRRKDVFIKQQPLFSQQFDFSDMIGMDPDLGKAIDTMPYEFRTKDGEIIARGNTSSAGETERIFTAHKEELILFLGDGEWSLSLDSKHDL
jgi:hypothetical protein